jgi:hypothetical protein
MNEPMKRLTRREAGTLLDRMREAARPGPSGLYRWERWQWAYGERAAWVEFPLGELMNPHITGFVWAWATLGGITSAPIQSEDRFNAQGLPVGPLRGEGKVKVRTTLSTALLVYRELPPYRCQIVVESSPRDGRRDRNEHQGETTETERAAPIAPPVDLVALV